MSPILPPGVTLVDKTEIRLVNQGRGLECVPGGLAAHEVRGQLVQLVVDEWEQLVEHALITLSVRSEKLSDVLL